MFLVPLNLKQNFVHNTEFDSKKLVPIFVRAAGHLEMTVESASVEEKLQNGRKGLDRTRSQRQRGKILISFQSSSQDRTSSQTYQVIKQRVPNLKECGPWKSQILWRGPLQNDCYYMYFKIKAQ